MQPTPDVVRLCDPSPKWIAVCARERRRLAAALGDALVAVEHIGSTAIPTIRAKPVVDLLPVVVSLVQLDDARERIEALGYSWWGEYGIARRRFCTLQDDTTGRREVNVHFFAQGDPEVERHIAFRDYLRAHADVARAYEAVALRAAAQHSDDVNRYNDEKAPWIRATERLAIAFYRQPR